MFPFDVFFFEGNFSMRNDEISKCQEESMEEVFFSFFFLLFSRKTFFPHIHYPFKKRDVELFLSWMFIMDAVTQYTKCIFSLQLEKPHKRLATLFYFHLMTSLRIFWKNRTISLYFLFV